MSEQQGEGQGEQQSGATPGQQGEAQLGDAGKRALAAEREARSAAEKSLKAFTDLGLTVEQVQALVADGASAEDVREQARREAEQVFVQRDAQRARATELRAQAAEAGFHSPADVVKLIDPVKLDAVKVSDSGDADASAVKSILEDLKKSSPYLVKGQGGSYKDAGIGGVGGDSAPAAEPGIGRLRAAYSN